MRRLRLHRMAGLVLLVLLAAATVAASAASRVVESNEDQLLRDRTAQIRGLLESLGTGFEAQQASVAAIADVTHGDPAQFRAAVAGVDQDGDNSGWALLRRGSDGFELVDAIGGVTAPAELPTSWQSGLEAAARGQFRVLGFLGEGMDRRFAMVTGRTGVPSDFVVYNETPLLGATAGATADQGDTEMLKGIAVEVFIGEEPDPDRLLLAFGAADESNERREIAEIAGVTLLVEVSATEPLIGTVASRLPVILFIGGALLGLSIAAVVEMSQRRRFDALTMVRDLERQNRLLDHALAEQRSAEKARAALEDELRQSQRLEAVGHLAGGVAHDFNNVLAAILSYADLASDEVTDPGVRADLEAIQSAARRGAGLTRQLLQFSRREPGEAQAVDVNARISEVMTMLERTLGEDKALRAELSLEPLTVHADPVELDQIVLNLVVNARDAVAPGGTIEVATARVDLSEAEAAAYPALEPGRYVRLSVSDDGHGMDADVLDHAFEPFFTTKGRGQGTGLGLSTVYGIVQRQGGHVAARSMPGEGTTVEVLLPAVDVPAADAEAADVPSRAAGVGDGRRILLVEDEEPLRRAMRRMLERAGFDVLDADDGSSALARHGEEDIDLLLTDIVMPGTLSGVDVAQGFRARTADLPVVFVTGYSDANLDGSALDGTTRTTVLTKPFTEADLINVVGAAMGASR